MKKSLRRSEVGDVFAIPITKNKKYQGKYIILIRNNFHTIWEYCKRNFYVKIVDNLDMETIWQAPYIKSSFKNIGLAKQDRHPNYDIPEVDKYGFIYAYSFEMFFSKKEDKYDLIYLGNFSLVHPENEFVSINGMSGETSLLYTDIEKDAIRNYEEFVLKKSDIYTKEGNLKAHQALDYDVFVYEQIERDAEKWKGREKEWLLSLGIDIDEEIRQGKHLKDSLTFVGPEEERKTNKKKKK